MLDDPPKKENYKWSLLLDAGEPFIKATYRLEGDGPLAFIVYEEISTIQAAISSKYYRNESGVAKDLSSIPTQVQQLVKYAESCVEPAYKYFEDKLGEDLAISLSIFKQARKFDPSKIVDMHSSPDDIEELCIFPFLNSDSIIHELKSELPKYLAAANDVDPTTDKKSWWKRNEEILSSWSKACKSVLLVQPLSAAAERVFSILSNSFTDRQEHALRDYIETSVLLQYNCR